MKMTSLRKLLKDNKKCNPFNDAYDGDEMVSFIKAKVPLEEFKQDPLRDTIGITDFLHTFFKEFFQLVKENIASANRSHNEFMELLFVAFNRNYLVVLKKQIEHVKKHPQGQNDLYKFSCGTSKAENRFS